MTDTFNGLTRIAGIGPEYPEGETGGEGIAGSLASIKEERAGTVATTEHPCVSSDFGGSSPVPPAMRAAQVAEATRRLPGSKAPGISEDETLESD